MTIVSLRFSGLFTSVNSGSERDRWSKWLLFAPGAITFGLGTWQISRRNEKSPVLVNRGWVPHSWRVKHLEELGDAEKPSSVRPTEVGKERGSSSWWFWSKKPEPIKNEEPVITPLKVLGIVWGSEKPSIFVPSNDPNLGQWFYVDVPEIARACGLPEDTLYIEDINENASPTQPYPVPKDVNSLIRYSVMPQDHLNYTLTWYSLSAAVTFMAITRVKPRKARR